VLNIKTDTVILVLVIAFIAAIELAEIEGAPDGYDTAVTVVSDNEKINVTEVTKEITLGAYLIELAVKYGVPFAETCLKRLADDLFGSGRATRSTDAVIFNKSSFKFKCTLTKCDCGSYTSSLLPEHEILPKTSSVFGMESTNFLRGLECATKYQSVDGTFFEIKTSNPMFGKNSLSELSSPNLILTHTLGSGNNNQIQWIVENSLGHVSGSIPNSNGKYDSGFENSI